MKRISSLLLVFITFVLIGCSGKQADTSKDRWVKMQDKGTPGAMYYDRETAQTVDERTVRVYIKMGPAEAVEAGQEEDVLTILYEFRDDRFFRVSKGEATGVMEADVAALGDWSPCKPGSIGETLWEAVWPIYKPVAE